MKFIIFLLSFFVLSFTYVAYVVPSIPVAKQDFIINKGETLNNLPEKLLIDVNPISFKLYTKFFVKNFVLQAGTYSIDKDITLENLFSKILKNPSSKDITITLLPGWNIWDIDAYLTKNGILSAGEFTTAAENISPAIIKKYPYIKNVSTLEGFFIPDTYRISPESSVDRIVETLLSAFDKKIYNEFDFTSDLNLYETLIFASILEKEEKSSVNKPIVAGILKKRYKEKWFIGADATVCYAYRLTMTDCTPSFINKHIYEKTVYNTRNNLALPPTPIANPSVDTIRATIQSQPSSYYYYLHDDNGYIHYGKTLEDHNRNRVEYLGK